ncbi:nucleoside/nucleotide kinase family protein [Arthrobacter sp. RAF14]|uniref:nucleoside/nucleotide kinase family protein n=1 Tax=Arthrobacter sp. RAF14 TaxID=3233051 RepID=UPI003F8E4613
MDNAAPDTALPVLDLPAALQRVEQLLRTGDRVILGLAGCPGAGKTTLSTQLVAHFGPELAVAVPLDGYHLANVVLEQRGLRHRKGAPETFDGAGYLALLRRLRARDEEVVFAPEFRREIEEPVAGAIPVPRAARLIVTEGNYLLLPDEPWAGVLPLLDEAWSVEPDEDLRVDRLIARHEAFGKSPEAARAWALGTDEANARLIRAARGRAAVVVRPG